jgi:DNA-binding MarR family transcriptional regulator
VITFTGDAGFWYHISELETAVRWKLNTITLTPQPTPKSTERRTGRASALASSLTSRYYPYLRVLRLPGGEAKPVRGVVAAVLGLYRRKREKDGEFMLKNQAPAALTGTEFLIMSLLVEAKEKELYGLEMVQKSGGRLKRGTVYVLLDRLEKKKFIEGRTHVEGAEIPRRVYKPTGEGRRVYDAWREVAAIGGFRTGVYAS